MTTDSSSIPSSESSPSFLFLVLDLFSPSTFWQTNTFSLPLANRRLTLFITILLYFGALAAFVLLLVAENNGNSISTYESLVVESTENYPSSLGWSCSLLNSYQITGRTKSIDNPFPPCTIEFTTFNQYIADLKDCKRTIQQSCIASRMIASNNQSQIVPINIPAYQKISGHKGCDSRQIMFVGFASGPDPNRIGITTGWKDSFGNEFSLYGALSPANISYIEATTFNSQCEVTKYYGDFLSSCPLSYCSDDSVLSNACKFYEKVKPYLCSRSQSSSLGVLGYISIAAANANGLILFSAIGLGVILRLFYSLPPSSPV